jgi:hypothetical protein
MQNKIMYVCESCAENAPDCCGHFHRDELRVVENRWICNGCYDDERSAGDATPWSGLPTPPEYVPAR